MYGFYNIPLDFPNGRPARRIGWTGLVVEAPKHPQLSCTPHFKPGDMVREKMPFLRANETGVVIRTYPLDGEYRCVVNFESGREGVYFERELNRDRQ
jgi:hypothetical protein